MTGLRFPSWAKLKPSAVVSTRKPRPHEDNPLPDVLRASLLALKDSADAFPPLKSAVGGRAKHSKDDTRDVALRANEILNVVADAVPDVTAISPSMKESIKRFAVLLDHHRLKSIALASGVSRVLRLHSNEWTLQKIKAQLDDAYRYRTFLWYRWEPMLTFRQAQLAVQQTQLSTQQVQTQRDVGKLLAATTPSRPTSRRVCGVLD
ncbi:hypothetical protein FB451DRAFT_1415578 [Mycena latifolia]|nr:hypothetical protein FB451DRAFT_1415578 [Mycena latifolia]